MAIFDFGLSILGSVIASDLYSRATRKSLESQLNILVDELTPVASMHLMQDFRQEEDPPFRKKLLACLGEYKIPSNDLIEDTLFERWLFVRKSLPQEELDDFFRLTEAEVKNIFQITSSKIYRLLAGCKELQGSALERLEQNIIAKIESSNDSAEFQKLIDSSVRDHVHLNNVFPGSGISVDEIYVSPIAESMELSAPDFRNQLVGGLADYACELLQQQNCVVINGGYGSGKTVSLKKIRNKLVSESQTVVFYSGIYWKEYLEYKPNFDNLKQELKCSGEHIYLIIDAIEDYCDFSEKGDKKNHFESAFKELKNLCKDSNIKMLLSVRDSFENAELMSLKLSYLYSSEHMPENTKVITLKGFNAELRRTWLEKYEAILGLEKPKAKLLELRKNKKLTGITANPLGLYVVSSELVSSQKSASNINSTMYYRNFIDKTIKGKFSEESKHGAYFLRKNDLTGEYRKFVKELCFELFTHSEKRKDISNKKIDYSTEWPTDPNFVDYDNSLDKIQELATRFIDLNTKIDMATSERKRTLLTSLLSCYFFTWKETHVTLKDNNILHYFLGVQLADSLLVEWEDESLEKLGTLNISGYSINYAIDLIMENDDTKQAIASANATKYVKQFLFGEGDQFEKLILTRSGLRNLISLYVLCLKMNWLNFDSSHSKRHLQVIPNVIWIDEVFKIGYKSLIYRAPYGITIENQEIKAVNLDDFNFSNTTLNNVTFVDCSFSKTLFNLARFNGCIFKNCQFYDASFAGSAGGIIIEFCHFHDTQLLEISELEMIFKHCRLLDCHIDVSAKNSQSGSKKTIQFDTCTLRDIKFTQKRPGKKLVNLSFSNCILSGLKIRNTIADVYASWCYLPDKGVIKDVESGLFKIGERCELKFYGSNVQYEFM